MGKIRSCDELYLWTGPPATTEKKVLSHPPLHLSPEQQAASEVVIDTFRQEGEMLLWAVCGAGKTELLFPGITEMLRQRKVVALVTPRRDVVVELLPRLRHYFQGAKVVGWFGESPENGELGDIVLSTVHQLWRVRGVFSAIVVDEVDAFPLANDADLFAAIQASGKQNCPLVYLTATPSRKLRQQFSKATFMIPLRYHRYVLPVPRMKWAFSLQRMLRAKQPKKMIQILQKCQRQTFVFFPTIELLEKAAAKLADQFSLVATHSKDPERKEKIEKFRRNEVKFIFTTTMLERGVTVPRTDVVVFDAHHEVFSSAALIQMSGRVGRSADSPDGEILWVHNGLSDHMSEALRTIHMQNNVARQTLPDVREVPSESVSVLQ
ncbi:MAG: helicase-related protein [Bacilli bacterium]